MQAIYKQGFTFIEILVYITLFSLLLIGITTIWLTVSRFNITFEKIAREQEESIFVTEKVSDNVDASVDYASAQMSLNATTWHVIYLTQATLETTSSVYMLGALHIPTTINHLRFQYSFKSSLLPESIDFYNATYQ